MAKSTQVITDLASATTTAFGATAEAACLAAGGPITSLEGQANLALRKAQELKNLLIGLVGAAGTGGIVASGDPNFTALDSVRQVLV